MSEKIVPDIAVVGIYIGKTSFHIIGLDRGSLRRRAPPEPRAQERKGVNTPTSRFENQPLALLQRASSL